MAIISEYGNKPNVTLSWSDDGGHTFTEGINKPVGELGEYNKQTLWNRLGSSRDRVFKISMSAPVKFVIIAANIEMETLR